MARYERGVYEPSDEVRVFDGAEEDEDDSEGSRLPLVIVLALIVLCAFGGVVWLAYVQGVARGRTETPVLAAVPGPEKVAPENPGGAAVPYQGFKIYEQPAPADEGDTKPAPQTTQTAKAEPVAPPAPKEVAPAPAPKEAAPAPVTRQAVNPSAPKPATPPPAMKPATAPATATGAPRTLPGVAAATLPARPTPAPQVAAAPAAAAPSGAYVLQIGAFKSQAEADTAWRAYKAKHAALLTSYGPDIQRADLGDKGTWYRLRIAGFADRDVASALCDRLKADSGACFLGK